MSGNLSGDRAGDRPSSSSSAGIATTGGEVEAHPQQNPAEVSPSSSSRSSLSRASSPSPPSQDSIVGPSSEELLRFREELRQIREERRAANLARTGEQAEGATAPPKTSTSSDGHGAPLSSPHDFCMSSASFSLSSKFFPPRNPSLAELGKQTRDTYSFPVDPSPKDLEQKAMAARFSFDSVTGSTVKLKNMPIVLHWNIREGSSACRSPKRGSHSVSEIPIGFNSIVC